jgi:hypothetical protein
MPPHRDGGQAQYVAAPVQERPGRTISATMDWMRSRLAKPTSVRMLAEHAAMSERTCAAEAFRNDMAAQALKNGQIVLVPEFGVQRFPDHFAYNFGGVCLAPPSGTVFPRDQWNFGIIDRLFQFVRMR